jgi:hypothetical protein
LISETFFAVSQAFGSDTTNLHLPFVPCIVKKGHEITFSSELIHILLLKIPKVSNILKNSS